MPDHSPAPADAVARARATGALYLVIIACGLFGEAYVRSSLIVAGDAAATSANIAASASLWRAGFAADLVAFLADVAVAGMLYVLLRPVSRTLALVAAGFRLVGTAIYGTNLLYHLAALLVAGGPGAGSGFTPGQQAALVQLLLDIHAHGYDLGLVFFGLHCLLIGVLLFRSPAFPGALGVLMVLAAGGYLLGSFTLFLAPAHAAAVEPVYVAPLVGELAFCLWLLVKGVRPAVDCQGRPRLS